MRIAVMQPYFLPYLGYFQLIAKCDVFVFYDDDFFKPKGFIHRNYIEGYQQEALRISIPLAKKSQNKKINETEILALGLEKTMRTIEQRYAKASFKSDVEKILEFVNSADSHNLADFNSRVISFIARCLEIQTRYTDSSLFETPAQFGYEAKIIYIAKTLGATSYLNMIGGQHLYQTQHFLNHGIDLEFLRPELGGHCFQQMQPLSIVDSISRFGFEGTSSLVLKGSVTSSNYLGIGYV